LECGGLTPLSFFLSFFRCGRAHTNKKEKKERKESKERKKESKERKKERKRCRATALQRKWLRQSSENCCNPPPLRLPSW
jgi:hypothetical protein